jgi:hypothetical protein
MIEQPKCSKRNCKFFMGIQSEEEGEEAGQVLVCSAFPEGIPVEIAYGNNPHTEPYEGDRGIQYEKFDG